MKHPSTPAAPASPGGDAAPSPDAPAARSHDEWLLDESLAEPFPASDPIAPALAPQPEVG